MEPRREEPKVPRPSTEGRKKRFRIVKLEERIAPKKGGLISHGGECGTTTLSIE
jgi:hypothetical protein